MHGSSNQNLSAHPTYLRFRHICGQSLLNGLEIFYGNKKLLRFDIVLKLEFEVKIWWGALLGTFNSVVVF